MKTQSNDHTMTSTTNTTAAVMKAMCGMLSRRAHSFWRPLGFLLVFLYFLQNFCKVWSTVDTSTDTSAICSKRRRIFVISVGVCFICPKLKEHRTFVSSFSADPSSVWTVEEEHREQHPAYHELLGQHLLFMVSSHTALQVNHRLSQECMGSILGGRG